MDGVTERIQRLQDDTLEIARDVLNDDIDTYKVLSDIAMQLARINQPNGTPELSGLNERTFIERNTTRDENVLPNTVPIFARYGAKTHHATLDTSRITRNGRGKCVDFEGRWMTVSAAAGEVTGTSVNGWRQFWLYNRHNGIEAPIDEIRVLQLGSKN